MDSPEGSENEMRNDQIKGCFLEIYKKFVDEVEPSCILDSLIQERIVTIEEKERIVNQISRHEKCRVLLDKLFTTSNKKAFIVLYDALREDYPWLSHGIDARIEKTEKERQKMFATSETQSNKKLLEALGTIEKLQTEIVSKNKKIENLENSLSNANYKIQTLQRNSQYFLDNGLTNKSPDVAQLNLELNEKTEDIKKLENHIQILQRQIKIAASMNKSNDALDENEKENNNIDQSLGISYKDNHFQDGLDTNDNDENQQSTKRIIKLANYSGSTFDLWQGYFGSPKTLVMIKDLLKHPTEEQKKMFLNEIDIIKPLKHPRISNMISSSRVDQNFCIIYEGSALPNVLRKFKEKTFDIPADMIFRWIVQLASALDYLHSQLIIHRNIFSKNLILCNSCNSIKLSNFSNALKLKHHQEIVTEALRNNLDTAPEVITANKWSMKSDVWSFGMTVIKLIIRGKKICPELTYRDIKQLFSEWSDEHFDKLILPRLITVTRNSSHIKKCLASNYNNRPDMSEMTFFSKYVGNLLPSDFSQKYCFEQTLSHKCAIKGITMLKDMLYVIVVSSSSVKCYKKNSNKFERVSSIKLGYRKTRSFPNFLKLQGIQRNISSSSMDSQFLFHKPTDSSSKVLTSITSSERDQYLYVLDAHKDTIFQVNAEKRRVIGSFNACQGAHNISMSADNTLLVNCKTDGKNYIIEYNISSSKGLKFRVLNLDYLNSEPRKAIKLNSTNYLFFHKQTETKDETFTINVVDNESISSSGYGTLCLKNISDVAVHRPSGTIFWTDLTGNKIMFIDRYMNCEPQVLLNAENGICNPVKIYVDDGGQVFIGLMSGVIRYFHFNWWTGVY